MFDCYMRGVFISFEGGEGVGKTSQIQLLEQRLRRLGYDVCVFREPGGTQLGDHVRAWVQSCDECLAHKAELFLFLAARAQLTQMHIIPSLNEGKIVLCDRFIDSSVVYQGIGRSLGADWIEQLNHFATSHTLPDTTIWLDLPAADSLKRVNMRGGHQDRLEQEPLSFHEAIREGFQLLCQQNPQRFVRFDATQSLSHIEAAIWDYLKSKYWDHHHPN